jgi:hypothetical protein
VVIDPPARRDDGSRGVVVLAPAAAPDCENEVGRGDAGEHSRHIAVTMRAMRAAAVTLDERAERHVERLGRRRLGASEDKHDIGTAPDVQLRRAERGGERDLRRRQSPARRNRDVAAACRVAFVP